MRPLVLGMAWLLWLAALCFSGRAVGQKPDAALDDAVWQRERELLAEAEHAVGAGLLDIYTRLALLFKAHAKELDYLALAEQCARSLGLPQQVAAVMLLRLEYHAAGNDTEKFLGYAERVRLFMLEHGDERLANVEVLVIKRHIDEGRLQTALLAARKMVERTAREENRYGEAYAYFGIGMAYASGERYAEAVEALERSRSLMRLVGSGIPAIDRVRAGLELIDAASNTADYMGSLRCCDQTLALLEEWMADGPVEEQREVNCRSMRLYIHCYYVRNFVALGRFDLAADYLRHAESDLYPHIGLDGEFFNETCAIFYRATGRYAEALEWIDRSVAAFSVRELLPYYLRALQLKTDLQADMGDWEGAYANMKYIERTRDSLAANRFVMQLGELHTLYEVDKIEAQRARQRIVILLTGLGCVLLAAVVAVYAVYSYRLRGKNRSLYRQIQESMRNEDKAVRALWMASEEQLSREMKLFRRLTRLMEDQRPFTDPAFGRASLARMLCTNDKYLADAVREGAGVTVAVYISDWRLAYSLRLLAEEPEALIEEVAERSGHGSYSAFFRAFCRKYSMSPSDYRRFVGRKD